MTPAGDVSLRDRLTVLLTTSPVVTNPDTRMIEAVLHSFAHVNQLGTCRLIIVCDGYKTGEKAKHRSGIITQEGIEKYGQFIERLRQLSETKESCLYGATIHALEERNGFGFAVKQALELVTTPYVKVVQHDRNFVKGIDVQPLITAMEGSNALNYVGLRIGTTRDLLHKTVSKYAIKTEALIVNNLRFLPLLQWHDSTHICKTEYYRNFVFGPDNRVARGGFIEDKFGQIQIADIRANGMSAFEKYGTYVYDDGTEDVYVCHLDGHDLLSGDRADEFRARDKAPGQ
eukprot:comp16315_c0_seq1/m.14103 comp16315_c0_seq1/g.14103  ORF comp16315_c0_seq1/g.14103 comp16315_c0_seq1/m.14103 type:complete len:287 (-) comp16315_c0_seq1:294-1154(-)